VGGTVSQVGKLDEIKGGKRESQLVQAFSQLPGCHDLSSQFCHAIPAMMDSEKSKPKSFLSYVVFVRCLVTVTQKKLAHRSLRSSCK
jgi:hypothetical protein